MNRKAIVFSVVAVAQLAVPAWMVVDHERVRDQGEVFLFGTAPVDPRDPFRGEYVQLEFTAESGTWAAPDTSGDDYAPKRAYALLATDNKGYAVITALQAEKPTTGAYVRVRYYDYGSVDGTTGSIELPFDRYYLEEGDGPKTEELLAPDWTSGTPSAPLPSHAVVRILDGEAVITDLVVGDRSIHEWLKDPPPEPTDPASDPVPEEP
ncbi:MAG TPA: GDYXXLXY domain-containing protein [Flavobacteriales bacterium]|nr:GDYXXLXY domain-containing protein [Flavobacteriales bacterium]